MAGDWIKMRSNLWDDPRIARIVDMTDAPEAQVIGSLYWLWAMADQHSEDGYLPGLSVKQIDRKTGTPGFGAALVDVGWLADGQDGVVIQGFEEHNGNSAKNRLETAKRVSKHRQKAAASEGCSNTRELISKKLRDSVIERDGNRCVYCDRPGGVLGQMDTKSAGYVHIDHVIPVTQGGTTDESNLVCSCRKCNMSKGDRTPDEAGMPWPMLDGKRIGNAVALQDDDDCVSSALAREREREEVNNPPKAPPAEVEAPEAIAADAAQAVSVDVSRCRSDGKTTFETWYRACQEQGVKPLTEFDALWRYAEAVGLSRDLILLAWVRFKEHYSNDEKGRRKRYKDWRAVFLRSTKECWHRLWVIRDGSFVLTTVGQQAMRELEVAA